MTHKPKNSRIRLIYRGAKHLMGKRILLFLAVNFLILATVSFILNLLNIEPYLSSKGLNVTSLLIFCFIWGMVGSFISLALSKSMAKWMMGVRIIDPQTADPHLHKLLATVKKLADRAGLPMPDVGIYASADMNAFATGASKSKALVAVSSGLMERMSQDELEGVLAHELAHIANGDMITMTLVQGVVNAFVMFLARAIAFVLNNMGKKDGERGSIFSYWMTIWVLEMVFMILGSMVVAWFSRKREFRADAGGAKYAGKDKMIAALQALSRAHPIEDKTTKQTAFSAMKISGRGSRLAFLFATHPPLQERIKRLQFQA